VPRELITIIQALIIFFVAAEYSNPAHSAHEGGSIMGEVLALLFNTAVFAAALKNGDAADLSPPWAESFSERSGVVNIALRRNDVNRERSQRCLSRHHTG
jgi:hypothetical protein